jgi:ABC-type glycerol-3-phosphate transport system substrate-binding protein
MPTERRSFYSVYAGIKRYGQVRPISRQYHAVSQDLWTAINAAIAGKIASTDALKTAANQADQILAQGP